MTDEKNRGGRPLAYEELGPDFVDATVLKLSKDGKSIAEWADELGVARSTIDYWRDNVPRFSEVFMRARASEQAWWERQARENLTADRFQQSVWAKTVSARFKSDYAETSRHVHATLPDLTKVSDEELEGRLNYLLAKAGAIDPKTQKVQLAKEHDLSRLSDDQLELLERVLVTLENQNAASGSDSFPEADA
ncbi:MAG: helix-turn-helix domain-containing protein [Parvularculaceae bacterium]